VSEITIIEGQIRCPICGNTLAHKERVVFDPIKGECAHFPDPELRAAKAKAPDDLVKEARRGLMALRLEVPASIADDLSARVEAAFAALSLPVFQEAPRSGKIPTREELHKIAIRASWKSRHKREATDADVEGCYSAYLRFGVWADEVAVADAVLALFQEAPRDE
jgi:hypothetical protein